MPLIPSLLSYSRLTQLIYVWTRLVAFQLFIYTIKVRSLIVYLLLGDKGPNLHLRRLSILHRRKDRPYTGNLYSLGAWNPFYMWDILHGLSFRFMWTTAPQHTTDIQVISGLDIHEPHLIKSISLKVVLYVLPLRSTKSERIYRGDRCLDDTQALSKK